MTNTSQMGFPDCRDVRMRYSVCITLAGAAGVMDAVYFYVNGLFQPAASGATHQPMGFDQMMAYYCFAEVLESTISAEFSWAAAIGTPAKPAVVGIFGGYDGASTTPYTTWTSMKEVGSACAIMNCDGKPRHVKASCKPHKLLGSPVLGPECANTSAANPTRLLNYKVWAQSCDLSSGMTTVTADLTIDYVVRFTNRRCLTASAQAAIDKIIQDDIPNEPPLEDGPSEWEALEAQAAAAAPPPGGKPIVPIVKCAHGCNH